LIGATSRNDPSGQYWLGLMRDSTDRTNWKWLSGKDVSVSFWNLPGGGENCARYDGTKGWLWSDTNCNRKLFFICQHRKIDLNTQYIRLLSCQFQSNRHQMTSL
jgi:hypothetical protein